MLTLPAAVARSSSDDNAILYILPVLWMTSCLGINGEAYGRGMSVSGRQCREAWSVSFLWYKCRGDTVEKCCLCAVVAGYRLQWEGNEMWPLGKSTPKARCWPHEYVVADNAHPQAIRTNDEQLLPKETLPCMPQYATDSNRLCASCLRSQRWELPKPASYTTVGKFNVKCVWPSFLFDSQFPNEPKLTRQDDNSVKT